jgi:hypothetical protein
LETLQRVIQATPRATPVRGVDTHLLLQVLEGFAQTSATSRGADGELYWDAQVKAIAERYRELSQANDVTPGHVGRAMTRMGLAHHRYGSGYVIIWNRRQLDILREHFGSAK